jgi:alpha-glucoside transport system substrate-binding protein
VLVMLHDTPAARSLLAYLAGAQAQQTWIGLGGFTSVNRNVPLDTYLDPVARDIAQQLIDAATVRFGAGDLMRADVQRAWWAAMLTLVQDPTQLDAVLASMTGLAQSVPATTG